MSRNLVIALVLAASRPAVAGAVDFTPETVRSLPDAKPAAKTPSPLIPGAEAAKLELAPIPGGAELALPAPAVPAGEIPVGAAAEAAAPSEPILTGAKLEGAIGARIEKALTGTSFEASVLFDNVRAEKASVDPELTGIHLKALKKYEPAEAVRVMRERARDRAPIFYIAPGGTPIALKGDVSSLVEGGQVRLLEARATALGSMFVAAPRGTGAIKSREPELEAVAEQALAQGATVKQAIDRLEASVRGSRGDLRAAFAEAQKAIAEYLAARKTWKPKRDALYAKAKGNDSYFLKAVVDGADFKKNHGDMSVGGLLTERFPNADALLAARYPKEIEEFRRAVPNLADLGVADVENSPLMDRDAARELVENLKSLPETEIKPVRALSYLKFSYKPKDIPDVLDRLRGYDGGSLKPFEPGLRALTDEALPALERVDAVLDHLETSLREARTSGDVNDVLSEAKKTVGSIKSDATAWHAKRDELLAKAADPAVRSFVAAVVGALEWDRSQLTMDALLAKRFRSADQLLARLYPKEIKELREFIPGLADMSIAGFDKSIFVDREGVREFLAALKISGKAKGQRGIAQVGSLGEVPYVAALPDDGLPAAYQSAGYRLPYRVPGAPDIAEYEAPAAALPTLRPDGLASAKKDQLRARFRDFDRLIESNFRVLPMMNKSASGRMTKSAARAIVAETARMAADYEALARSAGDAKEGEAVVEKIRSLAAELESQWADYSDAQPLPAQLAARIGVHEGNVGFASMRNLHTLINYMHKRSLKLLIGRDQGGGSGMLTSGRSSLAFTDLDEQPMISRGRLRSPALAALLPRLAGIMNTGNDRMIIHGDEAWYHTLLGKHTAEIYVKFASPDDGGMLRVRYEDWETGRGKRPRMALLEAQLGAYGISYDIEDGQFLTAVLDKDHQLRSEAQLAELFPTVIRTLHEDSELNLYFTEKDQTTNLKDSQVREKVSRMAELFLAEDGWPDWSWNNSAAFQQHYDQYTAKEQKSQRKALRAALDEELGRLGLPAIPSGEAFGRATIRRHFTDAIHKALLTGEIAFDRRGIPQPTEHRPVEALADAVLGDGAEAQRIAALARSLDGLELEPIGAVGRLRAERAVWNAARSPVVLTVLRDPETGFIGYARAQSYASGKLENLSAEGLLEVMSREDIPAADAEPLSNAQSRLLEEKLRAPAEPSALLGDRIVGLAASAGSGGFVTAPVTFDRAGRAGAVLVVPYTTPDDIDAIGKSAAVVATGGGMLSHAAITTRERRVPSVIAPDAQWRTAGDERSLEFRVYRADGEPLEHRGLSVTPKLAVLRRALKEGDLVRVSGQTGELTLFPDQGEEAAAAHRFIQRIKSGVSSRITLSAPAVAIAVEEALFNNGLPDAVRSKVMGSLMNPRDAATGREARAHALLVLKEREAKLPAAISRMLGLASKQAAASAQPDRPSTSAGQALAEAGSEVRALLHRSAAPTVLTLGSVGDADRDLVGGKFAKLGEILAAVREHGGYVPAALSVTTEGYLRFLAENGLAEKLRSLSSRLDDALAKAKDDDEKLAIATAASREIRALIQSGRLDRESGVGAEIWRGMQEHGLADSQKRLAVRSSAVQEDQQDAAFAGAAESYIHVKPDDSLRMVVENFASFWLPRGILYRHAQKIPSTALLASTIIQEMAPADAAGVIFTRNPVSGADEIVISAGYGLGEGIVSGLVQTDLYVARKADGDEIRFPFVGDKRIAIMPTADGSATEVAGIPKARRQKRALSLELTRRLSAIAKALEDKFGYALDIEFAVSGDRIAILQARPVTTEAAR